MQSLSQTYQKYHKELQHLKKQISSQKSAHQNSLKQLQSTYHIIDEMKDMLRMEQSNNFKLKAQVADKSSRINAISVQYQEQISGIKEMIGVKDQELRRLSSALLVTDVDFIRLKVVNELQLGHKEQLEGLTREFNRKQNQTAEIRSKYAIVSQKNQLLTHQLKKQEQEATYKRQEINRKHVSQMRDLYDQMERDSRNCQKWKKKYQILEVKYQKSAQNYRQEVNKMNRQLQIQNRSLLANGGTKSQKAKVQKMQEQIMKLQDQLSQERQNIRKLENNEISLKRQIRLLKDSERQMKNDKERSQDIISELKREIQGKDSQKLKELQSLRRQYESNDKQDGSTRVEKQRANRFQAQNKRLLIRIEDQKEELNILKQKSREGGTLSNIRKELDQKDAQIEKLILQMQGQKKRQRTKSSYQVKDDSAVLKRRLKQANQKIVSLLKQKVDLHREVKQLKDNLQR